MTSPVRSGGLRQIARLRAWAVLAGLCMPAAASGAEDRIAADLILRNGQILSPTGVAQALAVSDGIIVALGDDAAVLPYRGKSTRVIELDGDTVLPGFHDMHVHPLGVGLQHLLECRFPQGSPLEQVLEAVRGCIARADKGQWIQGGSWDVGSLGRHPDRALLDAVSPDNPVVLSDVGHALWANSMALRLAGVTKDTPNPADGVIERDEQGNPTGVLREFAAGQLVWAAIPPYSARQQEEALAWALQTMLANGITSFTDAAADEQGLRTYAALADRGMIKQRARLCLRWRPEGFARSTEYSGTLDLLQARNLYARERLKLDCVKIVLDGVPNAGHTAAMVEPYADARADDPRARGTLQVPPTQLAAAVTRFDAQGLTVKFHATGDAAVRAALDAVAAARKANGFSGVRHDVAHNSFVQMVDLARARDIAATFEMSPYRWYPDALTPDVANAIGAARMERFVPVKDALDAGALVVPGSDWGAIPSVNPWVGIEALVTRRRPGGGGEALGAREAITLAQALDLYTANAAVQMGHRDTVGTIEPGMTADLIVIDRNPRTMPIEQVHEITVETTIIGGEIVYERK